MKIDRILVPLDFSSHSERALEIAAALARPQNACLDLVHAYHLPVTVATPDQVVIPEDFWASVRDAAREKLEQAADRMRQDGLAVETHLTERAPASAIVDVAEQVGVDLIVMGTRGNSGHLPFAGPQEFHC